MRVVVTFLRSPVFTSGSLFNFQQLPHRIVHRGFRCLAYLDDLLFLLQNNSFLTRRVALL